MTRVLSIFILGGCGVLLANIVIAQESLPQEEQQKIEFIVELDDKSGREALEIIKAKDKSAKEALAAFAHALKNAKDNEEKEELQSNRPAVRDSRNELLAIITKTYDVRLKFDAIAYFLSIDSSSSTARKLINEIDTSMATIEHIHQLVPLLARRSDRQSIDLLKEIIDKNTDRKSQAVACLALSHRLNSQSTIKEREKWLVRLKEDFGDIKFQSSTLQRYAERQLFAIRNLQVGCEVPDIIGEDIEGLEFKLSDYRGKVVLLDFWGHW